MKRNTREGPMNKYRVEGQSKSGGPQIEFVDADSPIRAMEIVSQHRGVSRSKPIKVSPCDVTPDHDQDPESIEFPPNEHDQDDVDRFIVSFAQSDLITKPIRTIGAGVFVGLCAFACLKLLFDWIMILVFSSSSHY